MAADPSRTELLKLDPDPDRPPLSLVYRVQDDGQYVADLTIGAINGYRVLDLLLSAAHGILEECAALGVVKTGALAEMLGHLNAVGRFAEHVADHIDNYHAQPRCSRCKEPGSFEDLEQNSGVCARCMLDADA